MIAFIGNKGRETASEAKSHNCAARSNEEAVLRQDNASYQHTAFYRILVKTDRILEIRADLHYLASHAVNILLIQVRAEIPHRFAFDQSRKTVKVQLRAPEISLIYNEESGWSLDRKFVRLWL